MIIYTVQTAFHCLNSSLYAYILLGKVGTLLEWADGLLSKMLELVTGVDGWMDTPYTVMTTRVPAVLKIANN